MFRFTFIIFCLFLLFPKVTVGEENPAGSGGRRFRIGFLRSGEDHRPDLNWYEAMKRFLLEQPSVRAGLLEKKYSGIVVLPTDGYRDMLQRMDLGEFDLAFCSSVIFVEQQGDYRSILQLRGEFFDPRAQGTLRKGVVFTGKNSPLFSMGELTKEAVGSHISSHPMAFVSAHNATGYVYPRLAVWRKYGVREPGDIIFCGSSEEVVKYVVNGLVDIGACDSATFETVLKSSYPDLEPDVFARVLFETPPAPTSPVVIRSSLHPRKSKLGRALKASLKIFYNNSTQENVPRITDTRDENFKNLREEIAAFHTLIENRPLAPDIVNPPPSNGNNDPELRGMGKDN